MQRPDRGANVLMPTHKTAYLCHGILSPSGAGQTDLLEPYFLKAGFDVVDFSYGFRLFTVLSNRRTAQKMSEAMKAEKELRPDVEIVGVGHSNGCLILKKAADLGAPIDKLVFLAPALDRNTKIDKRVKRIFVYYSPTDIATGFSKWIPFSKWGSAGNRGLGDGSDPRITNVNRAKDLAVPSHSHLDLFQKNKLPFLVSHILKSLEEGE